MFELLVNDIIFFERKINVCVIKFILCLNVNKVKNIFVYMGL